MVKHNDSEKDFVSIINRPEFKQLMNKLTQAVGESIDYFDFSTAGAQDFIRNNFYSCWYYGAKDVHTIDNDSADDSFFHLPKNARRRMMSFLDYCVEKKAVLYWKDFNRLTWCIYNKEIYKICCDKFGFRETDFSWSYSVEKGYIP